MARLLFQHRKTQLKHPLPAGLIRILPAVVFVVVLLAAGCSQATSQAAKQTNAQAPLTQKLQSMTPEQRTEYVKSHMSEVAGAAAVNVPRSKS